MLISYNWQRELTGTTLDPQELRERLTHAGLAVDAVEARDGDFVLDVEVPSNRGDCLSHLGLARELAVIEQSKVQSPRSKVWEGEREWEQGGRSLASSNIWYTPCQSLFCSKKCPKTELDERPLISWRLE